MSLLWYLKWHKKYQKYKLPRELRNYTHIKNCTFLICCIQRPSTADVISLNNTMVTSLFYCLYLCSQMHQLRCHLRMQELYRSLGDDVMVDEQGHHVRRLLTEMDLYCGVCSKPMGDKADRLDALPCFHIIHTRLGHGLLLIYWHW